MAWRSSIFAFPVSGRTTVVCIWHLLSNLTLPEGEKDGRRIRFSSFICYCFFFLIVYCFVLRWRFHVSFDDHNGFCLKYIVPGGRGDTSYIGMCGSKGYGFFFQPFRSEIVLILSILVSNSVWFFPSSLKLGMFFRGSYTLPFYKNSLFYKSIGGEICEILRTNSRLRFEAEKRI